MYTAISSLSFIVSFVWSFRLSLVPLSQADIYQFKLIIIN